MRRAVLFITTAGIAAALTATSFAQPSVPVGVWRDSNGGVCFAVSEQVPHCVDAPPVNIGRSVQLPVNVIVNSNEICVQYKDNPPSCYYPNPQDRATGSVIANPVRVTEGESGGYYVVGVWFNASLVLGAQVAADGSRACVGASQEVPFCV